MYNNQDILRKHTALTLGRKSVDTSLILFPVRLETRIVRNHPVEDITEPDRVFFAFQAIWNFVDALAVTPADRLASAAERVMQCVEDLDTVYREDKVRLRDIVDKIVTATAPQGEMAGIWQRVQDHIARLTTMDIVSDNVATDFIRRLEGVNRTMWNLYRRPRFRGAKRQADKAHFSSTAFVSYARKRVRECLPVLEQLLPDNPDDSIVNKFTMVTEEQFHKFIQSLDFLAYTGDQFRAIYGKPNYNFRLPSLKQQIINGLGNDLAKYDKYRDRFFGSKNNNETIPSRQQSLGNKVCSRIGEYHRYTQFAEKMIVWRLRLLTGSKQDIANVVRIEKWRKLADNTVFHSHEEREWLQSLLAVFNKYHKDDSGKKISEDHLNKHNNVIHRCKVVNYKEKVCMLVRIYPDEVAVTQLARPFTKEELGNALDFWIRYFYEYDNELEQKAAWKALCSLYTPPRAALIARSLFPRQKPCISQMREWAKQYREKNKSFASWEAFIRDRMLPEIRKDGVEDASADLFSVPMSELLPDRFILQATMDNGKKKDINIVRYGHLIPKTIQVGLDLNREAGLVTTDQGIKLNGNLRWMTDYAAAEKMGMAITVPLDAYRLDHHTELERLKARKKNQILPRITRDFRFRSIYVMGVKDFSPDNEEDSEACSDLLKKVFNAHLYSEEGLELLKIGTPTNILDEDTEEVRDRTDVMDSEYDTEESALVNEFFRKSIVPFGNGVKALEAGSDADILSSLFGIKNDVSENPFANTANRDNREVLKAQKVNAAFLDALRGVHPILNAIFRSTSVKRYFIENVLSTGVFPSFRIGNQPYGVLPVCDFKNLEYGIGDPMKLIKELLVFLTEKWNKIVEECVLSEENINKQKKLSTEESYLKAVSCTPVSSSFYKRVTIREGDLLPTGFFLGSDSNAPDSDNQMKNIYNIVNKQIRFQSLKQFIEKYFPKYGHLPVKDADFAALELRFNWGELFDQIKKKVQNEPCMAGVTDKELRALITGTFDLFNYRLDSWLTGLLSQRYEKRLEDRKHKISIGAYGWVFNLRETWHKNLSKEFIVAPSVNQAVTAAVLRSSFNRASNGTTKDYSLSVNLSSSRVRQALRIIDGIRNGLSLGTILGSDLERMLHDDQKKPGGYEMDYFIYFLRNAYPLNRTDTQYAAGDGLQRDASLDVLNGVALLEDLRSIQVDNQQKLQLTSLYSWDADKKERMWAWLEKVFQTQDRDYIRALVQKDKQDFNQKTIRLIQLIQRMEDAYDALADVITSESVYKLTEGNRVAVDALMNSMNTGRNFPEPDVVEIPLDAAHIEQRVFAALNPNLTVKAGDSESLYRTAEPSLDDWMSRMLDFNNLQVQFLEEGATATYRLSEMSVSPSELVYLSGDWDKFLGFLSLLRWHHGVPTLGKKTPIFHLLKDAEMAVDSMREMVSHARPLKQEDLIVSTIPADLTKYRSDLCEQRYGIVVEQVGKLAAALRYEADSLENYFAEHPYTPMTETLFRDSLGLLLQCFRVGILDALTGIDLSMLVDEEYRYEHPTQFAEILARQEGLIEKLRSLALMLEDRLAKAAEALADVKDEEKWEAYPDAMKKLFVSSFVMVPHFLLKDNPAIDSDQLFKQAATTGYFQNAGKMVVEDALVGLSDVRTQLQALHQVRMYGKSKLIAAARDVLPLQLESEASPSPNWLGAEVQDENDVRDANVYTVLNASAFSAKGGAKEIAGLMIDYWAERIPYRRQTAAVAFGYDQPDAEPPQAILVGMSTLDGDHYWSEAKMLRTIRCAMYQIKSRAVEPEHLYADKWTSGLFPLLSINPIATLS